MKPLPEIPAPDSTEKLIPRAAVITTYNRPLVAMDCIASVQSQVDIIYVIDNGDNEEMPLHDDSTTLERYYVYRDPIKPVNLSHLWNVGLDLASKEFASWDEYDIGVFNDDTIVPAGWFEQVSASMRALDAAAACTGPTVVVHKEPVMVSLFARMTGWGFMLRGEKGLRADEENFHWWFGDDDLDWRAREAGGMAMLNCAPPVANRFPNGLTTGERAGRIAVDAQNFLNKWGRMPW